MAFICLHLYIWIATGVILAACNVVSAADGEKVASVNVDDVGYTCNSKMCKSPHTRSGSTWNMKCKIQDEKEYICVPFVLDQSLREFLRRGF